MLSAIENYRSADIAFQSALVHLQHLEDDARDKGRAYAKMEREGADSATVWSAKLAWLDADRAAKHARADAEYAMATRDSMVCYS